MATVTVLVCRAAIRVGQIKPDLVGRVRFEEQEAPSEHVQRLLGPLRVIPPLVIDTEQR